MARAYGSDRVSRGRDGRLQIVSPRSKGWFLRTAKTPTSTEHPGTAVQWDGSLYEVVDADALLSGGVRYTLLPWKEEHVIRVFETYDEENESARAARDRSLRVTESRRKWAIGLGVFVGHLPSTVQERMHQVYGTPPVALTLVSCVPPGLFGLACVHWKIAQRMWGSAPPIPAAAVSFGLFLLVESFWRLWFAGTMARAIGSFLGVAGYSVYYLLSPRKADLVPPVKIDQPERGLPPAPSLAAQDRYQMLEPFLGLLTPDEQEAFSERFGFDALRWGKISAVGILVFCGPGALTSLITLLAGKEGLIAVPSFLVAASLVIEQIVRLRVLRDEPAGSFLGALVRPFARDLLHRAPEEGP